MATGLTLITPTGGRPKAFALCRKYMERQTFQGPVQWIIVDDGEQPQAPNYECARFELVKVYPEPKWQPGKNTQHRNLLAALPHVKYEKILIIEDDDWYAPTYLETMDTMLDDGHLVGSTLAHYYNVAERIYRRHGNKRHASLCETGMTTRLIPVLEEICREGAKWIDISLWARWQGAKKMRQPVVRLCVGIKGMPGRFGLGMGHRMGTSVHFKRDPEGTVLREWIGDEDAKTYLALNRRGA